MSDSAPSQHSQGGALLRGILALAVAAVAGFQLSAWIGADERALIAAGFVKDDAFFYDVLVDNFRQHGFFTLDGVMPTNGFQPLWMGILLALKTVLPGVEAFSLLRGLSWGCYVLFCGFAVWLATSRARPFEAVLRTGLLAGLVLLNRRFQDEMVEGLEIPMVMMLLCATLCALPRFKRILEDPASTPARRLLAPMQLGALAALVFLGRTDLFWLTGVLALAVWWYGDLRLRPPAVLLGASALLVTPYLAWNLLSHGALVPVSGRVKLFFLEHFLTAGGKSYWDTNEWQGPFSLFKSWLPTMDLKWVVAVVLTMSLAALALTFSKWGRRSLPDGLRILGIVAVAHGLYMVLVYGEVRPYTNYYFVPEVLFVVMTLGACVAGIRPPLMAVALVAYVLATSTTGWASMDMKPKRYWKDRMAAADRLEEVAQGHPVGAFWPGLFAELTSLDITPLDGVIGSNAYFHDYVKEKREVEYMRERGIRYVVIHGNGKKLLGPKRVKAPIWSEIGQERIWASRDAFKVVYQKGSWSILQLRASANTK